MFDDRLMIIADAAVAAFFTGHCVLSIVGLIRFGEWWFGVTALISAVIVFAMVREIVMTVNNN
jgi:hypothetical protein